MSSKFYVYTLAYPDRRIFYVGKGCLRESGYDRIDDHEREVRSNPSSTYGNPQKHNVIKEIWANGGEVVKTKVAFFDDEYEAYAYEWALINMTCYSDQLTNILRAPSLPIERREKSHKKSCKKEVRDTSQQRLEQARKNGYFEALGLGDRAYRDWVRECSESGQWCIVVRIRDCRFAELHGATNSKCLDVPAFTPDVWDRFHALANRYGVTKSDSGKRQNKAGAWYYLDDDNNRIVFPLCLSVNVAQVFAKFFVREIRKLNDLSF